MFVWRSITDNSRVRKLEMAERIKARAVRRPIEARIEQRLEALNQPRPYLWQMPQVLS